MVARTPHGARYGAAHQAARKAALDALRANPATPCARCGQAMFADLQELHLDHDDETGGYVGLSHAECNLRAGSELGHHRRWGRQAPVYRRRGSDPSPKESSGRDMVVDVTVHTQGYCRPCGGRGCPYATADSPWGRQPW